MLVLHTFITGIRMTVSVMIRSALEILLHLHLRANLIMAVGLAWNYTVGQSHLFSKLEKSSGNRNCLACACLFVFITIQLSPLSGRTGGSIVLESKSFVPPIVCMTKHLHTVSMLTLLASVCMYSLPVCIFIRMFLHTLSICWFIPCTNVCHLFFFLLLVIVICDALCFLLSIFEGNVPVGCDCNVCCKHLQTWSKTHY